MLYLFIPYPCPLLTGLRIRSRRDRIVFSLSPTYSFFARPGTRTPPIHSFFEQLTAIFAPCADLFPLGAIQPALAFACALWPLEDHFSPVRHSPGLLPTQDCVPASLTLIQDASIACLTASPLRTTFEPTSAQPSLLCLRPCGLSSLTADATDLPC